MQNPDNNIMKLIEFEQTVISGVNDQGSEISVNTVTKELLKLVEKLGKVGRAEDRLRILCIYLLCYSLPNGDFNTVFSLAQNKDERKLL